MTKNKQTEPGQIFAIGFSLVAISLIFYFLLTGYMDCQGDYVRGLFWMECING